MNKLLIFTSLFFILMPSLISQQSIEFVHFASSQNISHNFTVLNHHTINNNPNAILIVTPNFNPSGSRVGVGSNNHIGVYYSNQGWAIYNQNMAPMPTNAAFNVMAAQPNSRAFVHKANNANIMYNFTMIDNPATNNNPNAILLVTSNWNPGGASGVYNNHAMGVYYYNNKWAIFNQDMTAMPEGAAFNVVVCDAVTNPGTGLSIFVHRCTETNISQHRTSVDDRVANFIGDAMLFVTPNWNPGGVGSVYNNHAIGVEYLSNTQRWNIFNQDLQPILPHAAFNVFVRWEGPK